MALNAAASALASGSRWREARLWRRAPEHQTELDSGRTVVLQGLLMATEVDETTVMTLGASVRAGQHLSELLREWGQVSISLMAA